MDYDLWTKHHPLMYREGSGLNTCMGINYTWLGRVEWRGYKSGDRFLCSQYGQTTDVYRMQIHGQTRETSQASASNALCHSSNAFSRTACCHLVRKTTSEAGWLIPAGWRSGATGWAVLDACSRRRVHCSTDDVIDPAWGWLESLTLLARSHWQQAW